MADNQFFHCSLFGREPRRDEKRHQTAVGMLDEAARQIGAIGHIETPLPPKLVAGVHPLALIPRVQQIAEQARDRRGRRLRSDGRILLAMVISYPVPREEITTELGWSGYSRWRDAVLDWLSARFGAEIESVVEHRDEFYLHLHAFGFPRVGADGQLDWSRIHPGRSALVAARTNSAPRKQRDIDYSRAMKGLLDDFHDAVGVQFGHDRIGPARERRSRAVHLLIRSLEEENRRLRAELLSLRPAAYNPIHRPINADARPGVPPTVPLVALPSSARCVGVDPSSDEHDAHPRP